MPPTSIVLTSDGTIQLQISGTPDKAYILQTSGDLRLWSALSTNVATGGIANITEHVKTAHQFYRAMALP